MPLTDTAIRNAKPKDKPYKITDEKGLYLLIRSTGKYFRFDYRFNGKRKTLALGVYPDISLAKARERRNEARTQVANDIDPSELKKIVKHTRAEQTTNCFEAVAKEWFTQTMPGWTKKHAEKVLTRLERDIFPWIGGKPVSEIKATELTDVIRRIEDRGALETARRAKYDCSRIFRYAINYKKCAEHNTAADVCCSSQFKKVMHFSAITEPRKIGELLRAIDGYSGSFIVKCALRLSPLVFVRPGELRHAEWQEIDLERKEWRIPAEKMKMWAMHIVPLSWQAVEILEELQPYTGQGKYLFPSIRTGSRPMSENSVNAALRRLGYTKEEMTGHGFRSMASTSLHEQGWKSDVIERQLAHNERNLVKAAYNHAAHLPERRKMMNAWANYLDGLKAGSKIVPIKAVAG